MEFVLTEHFTQERPEDGRVVDGSQRRRPGHLVGGDRPLRTDDLTTAGIVCRQRRVGGLEVDGMSLVRVEGKVLERLGLSHERLDDGRPEEAPQ